VKSQISTHRNRLQRLQSLFWSIAVAIVITNHINVSQAAVSTQSQSRIVIEKEILIKGINGIPSAVAQMPGGEFVIAGYAGTAWAVAVDVKGNILWRYEIPQDPRIVGGGSESKFVDVVPLSTGDILLCGMIKTESHGAGVAMITILDKLGKLVEQRQMFPKGDSGFLSTHFNHCLPWNDGIVLSGVTVSEETGGSGWLVKLTRAGTMQSEIQDRDLIATSVAQLGSDSLVLTHSKGGGGHAFNHHSSSSGSTRPNYKPPCNRQFRRSVAA
jgi:hypothetical protein